MNILNMYVLQCILCASERKEIPDIRRFTNKNNLIIIIKLLWDILSDTDALYKYTTINAVVLMSEFPRCLWVTREMG